MDRHEEAVMQLLTANGDTFLAPQYDVAAGWACPEFVALRPAKKQVWVVAVTASGYPLGLVDKINQRVAQWYAPLLEQLQRLQLTDASWSIGLLVFVRNDQMDWLRGRAKDLAGVHLLSLEAASAPWQWADAVWTEDFDFATSAIAKLPAATAAAIAPSAPPSTPTPVVAAVQSTTNMADTLAAITTAAAAATAKKPPTQH